MINLGKKQKKNRYISIYILMKFINNLYLDLKELDFMVYLMMK